MREWCERELDAAPREVLFRTGHLSVVAGLRLDDGREVVVKVRPAAPRLDGCTAVQRALFRRGFPCPEPLVGPTPLDGSVVTAETLVPGGEAFPRGDLATRSAAALARLVALAPSVDDAGPLSPAPPWVGWGHDGDGLWPEPDEGPALDITGLSWLDAAATRVRARLVASDLPLVVGHADWWTTNVLWRGSDLHVVHDWDSVAAQPEAALVGAASATYSGVADPGNEPDASASAAFLSAYESARGRPFPAEEGEVAWAAGLWMRLFNAKKEVAASGGGPLSVRQRDELAERLGAAGL